MAAEPLKRPRVGDVIEETAVEVEQVSDDLPWANAQVQEALFQTIHDLRAAIRVIHHRLVDGAGDAEGALRDLDAKLTCWANWIDAWSMEPASTVHLADWLSQLLPDAAIRAPADLVEVEASPLAATIRAIADVASSGGAQPITLHASVHESVIDLVVEPASGTGHKAPAAQGVEDQRSAWPAWRGVDLRFVVQAALIRGGRVDPGSGGPITIRWPLAGRGPRASGGDA